MKKLILIYLLLSACGNNKEAAHQKLLAEDAANLARYKQGAFIANESKISDTEIAKTIIYPDKEGEWADTSCLIYINMTTQKQNMNCQGVNVSSNNDSESSNALDESSTN